MPIKPIYDTATIKFSDSFSSTVDSKKIKNKKIISDPKKVIPNGIYKVFHFEKKLNRIQIVFSTLVFLTSIAMIILFATNSWKSMGFTEKDFQWTWLIAPIAFAFLSFANILIKSIDQSGLKKSMIAYREDLQNELNHTPGAIITLYKKIVIRQINHNWLTIFVVFYLSIFTSILWLLQDKSWWILDFKTWITNLFPNPNFSVLVFAGIIVGVVVFQIIMYIFRKKRITDIQAFFGHQVMKEAEIETLKMARNKTYCRIFLLSIAITLIIPIIVLLIIKKFFKK